MENSIIIPAHNEEDRLAAALTMYTRALRHRLTDGVEVLVVANGCSDRTAQVTTDYALSNPEVRLIDIPAPVGKGGAVLEGFRQATGRRIIFVDADGATAPESVIDLLNELRWADIAIGSRWLKDSVVRQQQPLQRRIFSRLFNATVRSLFGLPYHDTQCGAKAFRRNAACQLATVVQETRWTFDVDLLLWARFLDLKVTEAPIVWEDKAGSTLKVPATMSEVAVSLWNMKRRKMRSLWDNRAVYQPEEMRI
ncbi:MAG: dolichyl-phosphate beta-glucosyltransferase [Isosphaeraceae bacterium]